MRAPLLVVALLSTLAACALPQGTATSPRGGYQPLRAFISPPEIGGLGFQVNRAAHVALFEVVPGRGAALVYPRPGYGPMSGYVTSGRFNLGAQRLAGRDLYLPAMATGALAGPRFYFLIASERPLDLSGFGAYGMGIRSVLGSEFGAFSPYRTMERLAEAALPGMADDGSWTTDLYMHWPEALSTVPADRYVLLTCNGYRVYVRLEYLLQAQQTLCGTRSESPVQPGDSAGVPGREVVPQRRAPRESGSGARERVGASAQLEEGRVTRERRTPERGAPAADRPGQSRFEGDTPRTRGGAAQPARGGRGEPREGRGARAGSNEAGSSPVQAQPERRERPAPPAREATPRPAPAPASSPAPTAEPRRADPPPPASPAPAPERCADC